MNELQFAKPPPKKKKRPKNNPVPTAMDICRICQRPFASTHECFYGTGQRQLSIKYGMQVKLCYEHHNNPNSKEAVHFNPTFDLQLKQEMQEKFESQHGHEKFMATFRKNYIGLTVEEYKRQGVA